MNLIASTSFWSENLSIGIGGGPTPLTWTLSPQKGWSPKKGMIVVGHCIATTHYSDKKQSLALEAQHMLVPLIITAALRPAAVVPAPPWCT